jgi:hypothetical protein
MGQPRPYGRTKNFTENLGSETDHSALNAELDAAGNSIADIRTNIAILQADDGKLRPAVVTPDSISAELRASLVAGVTADTVALRDAAQTSANSAAASATTATTKATEAAASATTATTKAGDASISANNAANSAASAAGSAAAVSTLSSNLADSADVAKGVTLIGYLGGTLRAFLDRLVTSVGASMIGDKGASVSAVLALNLRRPRKLFSKLFASASAITHIRLAMLGDSMAGLKMQQISASLDRRIGGINPAGVNTAGNAAGAGSPTAGGDLASTALVLCVAESLKYAYWPTGDVLRIDATGSAGWIYNGVNPTFTDVKVYYVKEPGAGTINLVVGGATVATANANAAAGLGILSYTQAAAQATVSTTVTGGSVRVLFAHMRRTDLSGVDLYGGMARGGLLLSDAVSLAQGRAIWQAALADIAPDFVSFEMDDDFGDGLTNDAAFNSFAAILDASCPNADKLIIGSTPRAANDAGKLAATAFLKGACGTRGASYLFFDSYYLMGTYAEMNAIFGTDDGVHPLAAAQAYAAEILWEFLGLDGFNLGYVSRAINDRGTASRLARGTIIGADTGKQLTFNTDATFGLDWTFAFPRTLSFVNDAGTLVWQYSNNVGVFPNVMPLALDFNTQGNVRKLDTSATTGVEYTRFRKTDNPGGGLMHMETGLIRSHFTRAELLAIPANAMIGAMAFCTDCTGGAQWVYAKGTSATDWIAVDGKTAI